MSSGASFLARKLPVHNLQISNLLKRTVPVSAYVRYQNLTTVTVRRHGLQNENLASMASSKLMRQNSFHISESRRNLNTKGDKELVEFLVGEIAEEEKMKTSKSESKLDDFTVETDGCKVVLKRSTAGEQVVVSIDVNHSVDADEGPEADSPDSKQSEGTSMVSKPNFSVELIKDGEKLAFNCSFVNVDEFGDQMQEEEEALNDVFTINEISLYKGEFEDNTYIVSGEIIDGYLYDLLMNMLEERGITNDFAVKLSEYCTNYEHSQYIGLLSKLKEFVSK